LAHTEVLKEKAYELGFDLIGVAPAKRAPHADAYASWVESGYAATMGYMARGLARRQDPRQVVPGARSVMVVGLSYFVANPPADLWNDPSRGRIARYAWGVDYHEVMAPRLRQLAGFIASETRREVRSRLYVDTGPVLERDFAAEAGLGFVGKNTCLINPTMGSFLFLGEILVDLELDYDEPAFDSGASIGFKARRRPATSGGKDDLETYPISTRRVAPSLFPTRSPKIPQLRPRTSRTQTAGLDQLE
jgi:epoxyqueuosine reductase